MPEAIIQAKSEGGLFPHTHTLEISQAAIEQAPAEGLRVTTSTEYSLIFKHKHEVFISQQELKAIAAGQTVTVYDTDKGRHSFSLSKNAVAHNR